MPRIDDISLLKKKPFKKKSYRPWNLLDDSHFIETKNEIINLDNVREITEHKPDTNRAQSEHKPDTNRAQTEHNQNNDLTETEHKLDTQPDTQPSTNWTQTEHKPSTKTHYSSLVGIQRKLLIFLIDDCKNTRSRITQEMSLEHLAESLKAPIGGLKTTLRRLEKKGFIQLIEFKNGRGGWRKYEIPDEVYQELMRLHLELKLNTNRAQTEHKLDTKLNTQPSTAFSSSSSVINNKDTTTSKALENESVALLPEEWEEIDLTPLADIGFSKHHLKQIANQNKISTTLVQESINAFAFDLKQNGKGKALKTNPINYLMGILRNGIPYSPPPNYESEESRAMRIYLERKREIEQKQIELEEELLKAEFNDWQNILTNEQIDEILPDDIKNSNLAPAKIAVLRTYFRNKIWPAKRKEILISLFNK